MGAGKLLHAVDAHSSKAGRKDWGMWKQSGRGGRGGKKPNFPCLEEGKSSPRAWCAAQPSSLLFTPVCLKSHAAETKRSLFTLQCLL